MGQHPHCCLCCYPVVVDVPPVVVSTFTMEEETWEGKAHVCGVSGDACICAVGRCKNRPVLSVWAEGIIFFSFRKRQAVAVASNSCCCCCCCCCRKPYSRVEVQVLLRRGRRMPV
jgi:hypothetical protein